MRLTICCTKGGRCRPYNATGSLFPSAVDRISLQGTVKPHRFKPVQAAMGCAEVPGVCIATGSAAQGCMSRVGLLVLFRK